MTVQYEVTIDDPKIFTKPWKVTFPIVKEPGYELFEYACHEGNHAMTNSLSGARADEKAAAAAATNRTPHCCDNDHFHGRPNLRI
jgi:hypothetical protein